MMIEIRSSEEGNEAILVELIEGYFDFYKIASNQSKIRNLVRTLREDPGPSKQFLAYTDGKYGGFVTLYDNYSTLSCGKVILMNDLYVDPKFRQQGIGKALLEFSKSYTKKLGYGRLEWLTEPSNTNARVFYDNMGGEASEWIYYQINFQ